MHSAILTHKGDGELAKAQQWEELDDQPPKIPTCTSKKLHIFTKYIKFAITQILDNNVWLFS